MTENNKLNSTTSLLSNPLSNPLLAPSPHPFGAFSFNELEQEHYAPAFDATIKSTLQNLFTIKHATSTPTFENTILAIETLSEPLDHVAKIFFNMLGTCTDERMQAMAKEFSPKLADISSDLLLDDAIFHRVKSVWDRRHELKLAGEELKLTETKYKSFTRNGALLSGDKKDELRQIDQELSKLGPEFGDHVLKATNEYQLILDKETDLEGLPQSAIQSYAESAKEAGLDGKWLITLHAPSFVPFMTYASKRRHRETLWRAYAARAINENQELTKRIVTLRHQRAKLLGYATHAHFTLEERMAATPQAVMTFLHSLLDKVTPAAQRDLAEVKAHKKTVTGNDEFAPWDYAYWSEKLKIAQHSFDEEQLRPYFKLENVIDGVFEHARRLYGLSFKARTDIPVYHQDVHTFEVVEENTGRHVGLFYADFFPRASKRGGAWMTTFRDQGYLAEGGGQVVRPHVAIVCNFTKPTATAPSLLTLNEVRTLFHEFGHALHGLLSECRYMSLAGVHVYWDFVELPSQIMENWVGEREALSLFAKHYQTGATIPESLMEKIKDSAQFQAGYAALRQLNFGLLDMSWHTAEPTEIADVLSFERAATAKSSLFAPVEGTSQSTAFTHIFAGGYSAGYYSYKWAEVLDADAFEFFKEKGLFNAEVARKFRDCVLARGGTEAPMELYKRFRGREPDPNALLRRDGLLDSTHSH